MSLRRILQRNRKAEAHRSSLRLEIDRTPIHASNVTSTPTHWHNLSLAGRDSANVRLSDETKSSLTDRLVADPSYSKRSSGPGNFKYSPHFTGTFVCSILLVPDLCWGRSYSDENICYSRWSVPRAHQSYISAASSHRQSCKTTWYIVKYFPKSIKTRKRLNLIETLNSFLPGLLSVEISETVQALVSSLHHTANRLLATLKRLLFAIVLALDPRCRNP